MNRLLELESQLQGPTKRSGGGLAPPKSSGARKPPVAWGKRPAARRKTTIAKIGASKNGGPSKNGDVSASKSFSAAPARPSATRCSTSAAGR